MKLNKLTALIAGMGIAIASGSASAVNLGTVWMTDQANGTLYVYKQSQLNSNPAGATPKVIDLQAATDAKGFSIVNSKNHIIGFNNKKGLSRRSRAHLAYLGGDLQVWKTRGHKKPRLKFSEHVTTSADSLHMCGGNPQNTEIMCSSIGGLELITYSANYATDTYTSTGNFALGDLAVNGAAAPGTAAVVASMGLGTAKPICNNYSTDGSLVFVTTTAGTSKGVLVLERAGMTIINAVAGTGTGCGLVNSQGGEAMFTNSGSNADDDTERVMRWDYATISTVGGPSATTVLPVAAGDNGDVHGAQFAGLGGSFLWELMRLDNEIHVLDPGSLTVVNTIDLAGVNGIDNLGGDVLDRSALGTRMYMSTRGFQPITAIVAFPSLDRDPGVSVVGTIFGYGAWGVGHSSVRSGNLIEVDGEMVDNADPHGLKSSSYLSGGF